MIGSEHWSYSPQRAQSFGESERVEEFTAETRRLRRGHGELVGETRGFAVERGFATEGTEFRRAWE
jgi:hypothetical protein